MKGLQEGAAVNDHGVNDCSIKTDKGSCNNSYNSNTQNQCMWYDDQCKYSNTKNDLCDKMTKDNCQNHGSDGKKCHWDKDKNKCYAGSEKVDDKKKPYGFGY